MYPSERFNAYSHLIGTALAIAATVLLIVKASLHGTATQIVAVCIYGASLTLLYAGSTLYHSVRQPRLKSRLQKLDHCAIYLLIAGSYTPFTLVTLDGAWGWSLFGVSWGLAVFGVIQDLTFGKDLPGRWLSLLIYVLMGWLVVVAVKPLLGSLSTAGLWWLLAGGLAYSIGIYWFVNDEKIRHGHGIWHLFVLLGSGCQFISIYLYVV